MMKLVFCLILMTSAHALTPVLLQMPENQEYMQFYLKRFFDLTRKNFNMPEENPLFHDLVKEVDHWLLEDGVRYQLTLAFGINGKKEPFRRLRLAVPKKFQQDPRIRHPSLPKGNIFLVEWEGENFCVLLGETTEKLAGWCRTKSGAFRHAFDEVSADRSPENWPEAFPRFKQNVVVRSVGGEPREVNFFQVAAHPSGIPRELLSTTNIFVRDAHLTLDRVSTGKDGTFIIQYP